MRRAWSATAAGYGVALLTTAAWGPGAIRYDASLPSALAIDVAMNACIAAGAVLFAAAWGRAGLDLAGGRWAGAATAAGAVALALAPNAPGLRDALAQIRAGELRGWDTLASVGGDTVAFAAGVPLLRMAFALRGSPLAPTWLLLGSADLSRVVYDWLYGLAEAAPACRPWMHALMVAALTGAGCAAATHRRTVRAAAGAAAARAAA